MLAYRLMKYERKLSAELEVCETQRQQCVCEVAGVKHGSPEADNVSLAFGTSEYESFLSKFNEFLINESDLAPVGVNMDSLVETLDSQDGNTITENDLALLEPFFCDSALTLVPETASEELRAS